MKIFAANRRFLLSKCAIGRTIMDAAPKPRLRRKFEDYFAAGTLVVWDVDLLQRRSHRQIQLRPTPTIRNSSGAATWLMRATRLPGWTFDVDALFPARRCG